MNIDLKSLITQSNNNLVFDLPNGQVLTACEDPNGHLLIDLMDSIDGDSLNCVELRGVMKPPMYDGGIYVITAYKGVSISSFEKAYNDYKETSKTGGYGQFYAVYKGSPNYLKGVVDALKLNDNLDYIEVKDGKIV